MRVLFIVGAFLFSSCAGVVEKMSVTAERNSDESWGFPVDNWKITSPYGWRKFRGVREFHSGVDFIRADGEQNQGSPILASRGGVVDFAGASAGGGGNSITIEHSDGARSVYGHLSKVLVSRNERVTKGQTIALMGNTGRSTGAHLHFEIYPPKVYGKGVDPCKKEYLDCANPRRRNTNPGVEPVFKPRVDPISKKMKAVAKGDTWLKKRPIGAGNLSDDEKCLMKGNRTLGYSKYEYEGDNYIKVWVDMPTGSCSLEYFKGPVYIFKGHFNISER